VIRSRLSTWVCAGVTKSVDFAVEHEAGSAQKPSACVGAAAQKPSRRRTLTKTDRRGRLGKRIAELRAIFFAAALGEDATDLSPMKRLMVAEAAELKALAELARGQFMRGTSVASLDDVIRAERRADQAVRALGISEAKRKPSSPLAAHFARPAKAAGA